MGNTGWKKYTTMVLVLVAALGVLGYVLYRGYESSKKVQNTNSTNQSNSSQPAPKIYAVNGVIKTIYGSTYVVTIPDGTVKNFTYDPKVTAILNRTTTKTGVSEVPGKVTDLKIGSKVVIYSKTDPTAVNIPAPSSVEIVK